ncbi:hypothetical protein KY284_025245 [Solanum tuberosum]|nr:hypothetical protein KY284_025245 [Solanum tuberosum]
MLKKDDVDVIIKSQQQILGEAFDGKEKAKSRERDREAARIAIASIKRTVNFDDEEKKKAESLQEEKANSHRKKIEKWLEVIDITSMKRMVDFEHDLQAEADLMSVCSNS